MPKREMADPEIKADVMNRLLRRNCWGAKYLPTDTLVNWLAKRVKRNGKRVRISSKLLSTKVIYCSIKVERRYRSTPSEAKT